MKRYFLRIFTDEAQERFHYEIRFQILLTTCCKEQKNAVILCMHIVNHRFDIDFFLTSFCFLPYDDLRFFHKCTHTVFPFCRKYSYIFRMLKSLWLSHFVICRSYDRHTARFFIRRDLTETGNFNSLDHHSI